MKNIKFFTYLIILLSTNLYAQNQNALQVEILPVCIVDKIGAGLQIALQRQLNNKIYAELGCGIIYDSNNQSGSNSPKANGIPIGIYSTEVSVKDAANSHSFTLPDKSIIDDLNRLGFKQVTPYKSYRLDRYGSVSIGLKIDKQKKWVFNPSIGIILGLANRTEFTGGLTSNLGDNPFIGSNAPLGWIVFQAYTRYWYVGTTSKITIERRIKEGVYVGLPIGINFIFDKNFRTDDLIFYTGLSLKVGF